MMVQPILTANQVIANKTMVAPRVAFGKMKNNDECAPVQNAPVTNPVTIGEPASTETDSAQNGEKLDINFKGCREYTLNGNKIDYFA